MVVVVVEVGAGVSDDDVNVTCDVPAGIAFKGLLRFPPFFGRASS